MHHNLKHAVLHFFNKHLDPSKPILLGFSGGPDSLALLYLLLEYKQRKKLQLALAHVDHNWREESASEAEQLLLLANELKLPFHLKTLNPQTLAGNLEAACRNERLKFFKELSKQHGYQAVILAHHADDQAETVLKRVFEGADLTCMGGLKGKSEINGLSVWRPLLNVSKNDILTWLQQRGYVATTDKTNLDPKYLRGRCRTQIIPYLTQTFGKEVSNNLCHLGAEVQELTQYLASRVDHYLLNVQRGGMGTFFDLSHSWPQEPIELKYLLRLLMHQEGLSPSREAIETVCDLVMKGKSDRLITLGKNIIHIDRKRIFIEHCILESLPTKVLLQEGVQQYGPWELSVNIQDNPELVQVSGWQSAWNGCIRVLLPVDTYYLGPAVMHAPYPGDHSSISKWWTNEKVPAFLRQRVPVIWRGDRIFHEFLTNRLISHKHEGNHCSMHWMEIDIKYSYAETCSKSKF